MEGLSEPTSREHWGLTFQKLWEQRHLSLHHEEQVAFARIRNNLQRFLTSRTGHYAVIALVSADIACMVIELLVSMYMCEEEEPTQAWNKAKQAFNVLGDAFSVAFLVELGFCVWAFGLSYFRSVFHCIDSAVILASFIIDVVLSNVLERAASLVIVVRLWRMFEILEESSETRSEQFELLTSRIEQLEQENDALKKEIYNSQQPLVQGSEDSGNERYSLTAHHSNDLGSLI